MARSLLLAALGTSVFLPLDAFAQTAATLDDETEAAEDSKNEPRGSLGDASDPAATESLKDPETKAEAERRKKAEQAAKKAAIRPPPPPRTRYEAGLDFVLGDGRAPVPDDTATYPDSNYFNVLAQGRYDFSPTISAEVRATLAWADVQEQTRRSRTTAFGNPELRAEYRHELSPWTHVPVRLGLGIPLAQGDPDPTTTDLDGAAETRAQRIADASRGWLDGELFAVGRLPITPAIGIVHRRVEFRAFGETKLMIAPKLRGDVSNPAEFDGEIDINSVTLRSVTSGGIVWNPAYDAWVGLNGWFVYYFIEPLDVSRAGSDPTHAQMTLEPHVGYTWRFLHGRVSYVAPIAGRLDEIDGFRFVVQAAWD